MSINEKHFQTLFETQITDTEVAGVQNLQQRHQVTPSASSPPNSIYTRAGEA